MILAICVVVDESKCLDIPIWEFSKIVEHLPFSLGQKQILRQLLVLRTLAIWRWYPWLLLLSFEKLMILVQWILHKIQNHLSQYHTISPRSTTRPLSFGAFVSNSAFFKLHMSIRIHQSCLRFLHNQEIPCSIDQSNGHHTFRQCCCINVFCRHICPFLRSLDFGQFHSLCTEFLLNPQVSGFHVSHSTETSPSPFRDDKYCCQRNARSQRLNTSQEGWIEQTLPLRLPLCMRSILLLVTTRQWVLVSCRVSSRVHHSTTPPLLPRSSSSPSGIRPSRGQKRRPDAVSPCVAWVATPCHACHRERYFTILLAATKSTSRGVRGSYSARVPRSSSASAQGICPPPRGRWSWWAGGRTGW